MLQILVATLGLVCGAAALTACGQQGSLYLPTAAPAAQKAGLPQPLQPAQAPASQPEKPASRP
ncbi:MAG: LPS translocon maturation chaperone LptM [Rhodoferax sp.]